MQDPVDQSCLEFKSHKLGTVSDALPQFVAGQRAEVDLRRSKTVAEVAVESDDLTVKVGA